MENNKENALKFIEEMDKKEGTESWTDSSDTLADALVEYSKRNVENILKYDENIELRNGLKKVYYSLTYDTYYCMAAKSTSSKYKEIFNTNNIDEAIEWLKSSL
jgi:squalene cyclase